MIGQAPGDSLRTVLDTVFADPKYHWVDRLHPWRWLGEQFLRLVAWFEALRVEAPAVYYTVLTVAVVVLVTILVHGAWLMARTMRIASAPDAAAASVRAERRDARWYRERAERLAAEGRFPEAMRAGFEAVALDLAAAGLVQWHPSKTAREYAREAKIGAEERLRLGTLVEQVYAASFAGTSVGMSEYADWRALAAGGWRGA